MLGKKNLTVLFVITIVMVVAAVMTSRQRSPTTSIDKTLLFPELSSSINDLKEISISERNKTITLLRDGDTWKVKEADNYPAKFDKIKQTAITITELKILAQKTANPERYAKLGVEDPNRENARSKLLIFRDKANKQLVSLIIGDERRTQAAIESPGIYVRIPDQKQTLLVAGDLDLSTDSKDWIESLIINIKPDRISSITVEHDSGSSVLLNRTTDEEDLVLPDLPEGKQPQPDYVISRMEDILENIRINGVKAEQNIEFPETITKTTVTTFDGLTTTIVSAIINEENYAKFSFQYTGPVASAAVSPETNEDEGSTEGTEETINVKQEAGDLNNKTSGWVYAIPAHKFELFTRKLEDLIEDKEEAKET